MTSLISSGPKTLELTTASHNVSTHLSVSTGISVPGDTADPSPTLTFAVFATGTDSSSSAGGGGGGGISGGLIAGIIAAVVLLVIALIIFFCRINRSPSHSKGIFAPANQLTLPRYAGPASPYGQSGGVNLPPAVYPGSGTRGYYRQSNYYAPQPQETGVRFGNVAVRTYQPNYR